MMPVISSSTSLQRLLLPPPQLLPPSWLTPNKQPGQSTLLWRHFLRHAVSRCACTVTWQLEIRVLRVTAPHPFGECGSQDASSLPSTDLGSSASATSDEAEAWALDFEVGAAEPGCEKEIENVNLNPDSALSCSAHIASNLDRYTLGVPDEASGCNDSGSDSGPEHVEVETENCGQALDGYARPALCGSENKVQEGGREVRQGAGPALSGTLEHLPIPPPT